MEKMNGATFRALRSYLGFSIAEIAAYLDVSPGAAREWDKGRCLVPVGAAAELRELERATARVVDHFARHYDRFPHLQHAIPMEIPRTSDDVADAYPEVQLPGPVTVDWWKHVGIRVCRRVPGLTLEWL